jgi:FtsH-binding integral membrane protein
MTAIGVEGPRRTAHFLRNLLEMTGAMLVGMLVGGAVFAAVLASLGMTLGEARLRFPAPWLLVMAVNMSVPMVVWMRHRHHSWRSSLEMAVAMLVPAIALIGLLWLELITIGPACGLYCALMLPAMVVAMLWRRHEYTA